MTKTSKQQAQAHFTGAWPTVEQWWFEDLQDDVPALIERALSTYLGPGESPLLGRGPHGKPYLPQRSDLNLSVSHGGGRTVLAVGRSGPIGVDCEPILPFDEMAEVAALSFTPAEQGWWAGAGPETRCERFYALWTRKEAVVKAIGEGLQIPLNSFEVHSGTGDGPAWAEPPGHGRWWVSQIEAPTGLTAACAATQPYDVTIRRRWGPS